MPGGFIGKACHKYLTTISTAMTSANVVHNKAPFDGMSGGATPPPALPGTPDHNAPHLPEMAKSGGGYTTGVGNQSNIVVKPSEYNEVLQKIQMVDARIAEEIYNLAVQIEETCETIYIVPQMRPKYLEYTNRTKSSLSEFQTLADEARMRTHEFVGEIERIDGQQA